MLVIIFQFIFIQKNKCFFNYSEENDTALARQLQEKMKISSNPIDRDSRHNSPEDQVRRNVMFIHALSFFFRDDRIILTKSIIHQHLLIQVVTSN